MAFFWFILQKCGFEKDFRNSFEATTDRTLETGIFDSMDKELNEGKIPEILDFIPNFILLIYFISFDEPKR